MRMVQGVDGNWYGYFADRIMATTADATSVTPGIGLDFGEVCAASDGIAITGLDTDDANGITWDGTTCAIGGDASPAVGDPLGTLNVLREAKDVNTSAPTVSTTNPNGLIPESWPFIQLYTLNPTGNVVIQYNKGGGVQTTTLTFDSVDQFAEASLDRASYTPGAEVHATITDLWLNIDPTDEDSWTFGTTGIDDENAASTNYQVFNENGVAVGDVPDNTDANLLTGQLDNLMLKITVV
jgi:hypothetical protein